MCVPFSVAGLLAAAVCGDHYEHVVIIEPEEWLNTDEGITLPDGHQVRLNESGIPVEVNRRTRVMQYTTTHVHQPITLMALRELFPDFDKEAQIFGVPWVYHSSCSLNLV